MDIIQYKIHGLTDRGAWGVTLPLLLKFAFNNCENLDYISTTPPCLQYLSTPLANYLRVFLLQTFFSEFQFCEFYPPYPSNIHSLFFWSKSAYNYKFLNSIRLLLISKTNNNSFFPSISN